MKYSFNLLTKIIVLTLLSCGNNQKIEFSQNLMSPTPSIINGNHIIIDEFNIYSSKDKSVQDFLTINISFKSTIDSISEQLVDSVESERNTFLFMKEFDKSSGVPPLEEIDESEFEIYVLDGSGNYEIDFRPKICDTIEILLLINDQLQYSVDVDNIRWIQDIATVKELIFWDCEK